MPNLTNSATVSWSETAGNLSANVVAELGDLVGVDLTTTAPVVDDVLKFNGTSWVPGEGGGGTLGELSDVDLTTTAPLTNDLLTFDGVSWVPLARSTFALASHSHVKADIADFAHTHVEADITDLGDYLPLSGGTLTGNLGINATADASHPLVFRGNGGTTTVGITQNLYGGGATLELLTGDTNDVLTPRIVLRGGSGATDTEFLYGESTAPTEWAKFDASALSFDVKVALSQSGNQVWHAGNFTPSNYLPLSGGTLTGNLKIQSTGPTLSKDPSYPALRVKTGVGYIDLGPKTTSYAHIYTDRANFYFNKGLLVNGTSVSLSNHTHSYLPLSGGTLTGNLTIPNVIYHSGDTNTYMQFHAADQWRVVTGGAERLEVNNSQVTVAGTFTAGVIKLPAY